MNDDNSKMLQFPIDRIDEEELRHMEGQEGIIFQGCGGDLSEWAIGINNWLTEEGILKDQSELRTIAAFDHDGVPNLLFTIADAEIDREKLESWRVATHEHIGGISLKDYVVTMLGGFVERVSEKPECELIGQNGNIFNLMGIASRTLIRNGMREQAKEMCERITGGHCESYHEALSIIGEYVTITGPQEQEAQMGMQM